MADPKQLRHRRFALAIFCWFAVGCSERSQPVRYPPPPPPQPSPGPAPVPTAAAPAPAPEAGTVKLGAAMLVGGAGMAQSAMDRSSDEFVAFFNANLAPFRRCYGAAATRQPGLAGEITVKVVTNADGSVYDLRHLSGTLSDTALVDCTLEALRSLRYPPHSGQLFAVETPVEYSP
jgi:outer membrane biosynthesis protein TonB